MPLKQPTSVLGDSRDTAVKRLEQVERRLEKNPELQKQYKGFITEYLELGHMEKVDPCNQQDTQDSDYYLPHHPVIKESSTTTKVRVVFDASAKSTSGKSLNDIQLVGPVTQSDLFSIIIRFRLFTYVMTADLEKMYRQIHVDPSQRNLLKIVWRDDPSQPVSTFQLKTVTYGTASAPYLATRTLKQLAQDEGEDFPEASAVINRDFYVDDVLTGTDTIEEGRKIQAQLIQLLSKGHFNLRKWKSNSESLLKHLPKKLLERRPQELSEGSVTTGKTLGLWWDAGRDEFQFRYTPPERRTQPLTKRVVLSGIARLFDPLGLVAPIVIRAKMQLQELWKLQLNWDESLPMHFHTEWNNFLTCLNDLSFVRIKRQATLPDITSTFELHGFSDASQKAYGGAVYIRHTDSQGSVKVSLMCAKSRVAPLKSVSIPRLELCAALLLCELITQVTKALEPLSVNPTKTFYWTDSTIVLAWLKAEPVRWATFVANRVSRIQDIQQGEWKHIRTEENPADLISRGTQARVLADSSLWWEGPEWLKYEKEEWPIHHITPLQDVPEERQMKVATFACTHDIENDDLQLLINRYSSFSRVCRILGYCQRFIKNIQGKKSDRLTGALTLGELDRSRITVLKFIQREFEPELKDLKTGRITKKNKLVSLYPFLDRDGIIRVGGRLDQSSLSFDQKHQVLLPKGHRITEMIATEEHIKNLHCGPQALLYAIRQRYWPINGRTLTRRITHKCIKCFKAKPKQAQQLMGALPSPRVNPVRAFCMTGVDYCGPFFIKHSRRRGVKPTKTYVAVFVCLATKALHLEMVSDLTTETFLGALKRFISRRGVCTEIYSDNGKNFVGANRQLQDLREFLMNESSDIIKAASAEGIKWSFIPPYAPHMGGIWEAAVKSLKHHLRRLDSAGLTCEEFNTLLTQIEAVLNSRPLSPLSNNPSDLSVLTPGHFLTGSSLKALPEPSLLQLPESHLSRWQRVQRVVQHFWTRWSSEYLSNLQQRGKWKTSSPSLQVGALVLLKEDNAPPLSWPMGRIIALHPGKDNLVRVASVKTSSGDVRRCIHKLFPLPLEQ